MDESIFTDRLQQELRDRDLLTPNPMRLDRLIEMIRRQLPEKLRGEPALVADIIEMSSDKEFPSHFAMKLVKDFLTPSAPAPRSPEHWREVADAWFNGVRALVATYAGKAVTPPPGIPIDTLTKASAELARTSRKDRDKFEERLNAVVDAWSSVAITNKGMADSLLTVAAAAEALLLLPADGSNTPLLGALETLRDTLLKARETWNGMHRSIPLPPKNGPIGDSPERLVADLNRLPKRPSDEEVISRIRAMLRIAPKPIVQRVVQKQEGRWLPIELRSRSGKQMFVCTRCGRVSPFPDKTCGEPLDIQVEKNRIVANPLPNGELESMSPYWADWVLCGEEDEG